MEKETPEKISEDSLEKLRQEIWELIYAQRVEILAIYRAAYEQYEKKEMPKELFERLEKEYLRQEDSLDALSYRLKHGPKRRFSKLIELRKEKELTQAEVAEKADISLAWYANLEQGHRARISTKTKQKVADALGVPYEKLFLRTIAWWGKKTPEEIAKLWEEEERERKK